MMDAIASGAQFLAAKFPVVIMVAAIVGSFRLINKPIFTFLHSVADATPSPKDNEIVDKVEQSKIWKGWVFVCDWIASIKLEKPASK